MLNIHIQTDLTPYLDGRPLIENFSDLGNEIKIINLIVFYTQGVVSQGIVSSSATSYTLLANSC